MKIISFMAPARMGKSTMAGFLLEDLQKDKDLQAYNFVKLSFAYGIRLLLSFFYKDLDNKNSRDVITGTVPLRRAMQTLGTNWGREVFGDSVWIDFLEVHAFPNLPENPVVIFDDVRFKSEVDWIMENKGLVILLSSTERLKSLYNLKDDSDIDSFILWSHPSEQFVLSMVFERFGEDHKPLLSYENFVPVVMPDFHGDLCEMHNFYRKNGLYEVVKKFIVEGRVR